MYSVSESYKNALLENVINDTVSGVVALTDGTVIELNDNTIVSGSLKISHELCGEYAIGTFNLGSLKIGFFDDNALLRDFSGAEIKISYKIETKAGWEEVPMGIFIVDGSTVKRKRNTITLTAYDYGILFDCALSNELRTMTDTAENLIKSSCELCGVTFGGIAVGLPNAEVVLNPASLQIQSCRDLVEWCAVLLCGYAVIDREGKLKIISAKYDVSKDDATDIVIDKYLGAFERDSFYSTDTRAWIATLSAYSGNSRKIYKSTITQPDVQAARAIYTLEKNPLLADKTESECDEINNAWLQFIDGFKQRGIIASIYGDPALDVGDVMRCSEGDIDQRLSIVGLITKHEWRYRNFHNIVCASAQLSDGFPEEENEENNEADDTATDKPKAVKVISQLEKRLDGIETGSSGAGVGIFINKRKNAERFNDYSGANDLNAGDYSHAEGYGTQAKNNYAHAEGFETTANGEGSHSEGKGCIAYGSASPAEGTGTEAGGAFSHSEGGGTSAAGYYSHSEGMGTEAGGYASHSEGYSTMATGSQSHAEGAQTAALGSSSHAEGEQTKTAESAHASHAEGSYTTASGNSSHAEGVGAEASGYASHAEGNYTTATGFAAHSEGNRTTATGNASHACGIGTIASFEAQTAIGKYNAEMENALFLIGGGKSEIERLNVLYVDAEGNLHAIGRITADGGVGDKYISGNGTLISETETKYTFKVDLTPATAEKLGGVKVGSGLTISGDGVISAEAYTAGDGIDILDKEISVKLGNGLEFDSSGAIALIEKENPDEETGAGVYSAGDGIEIISDEESEKISVKVGEGLEIDENGAVSSMINADNAIIIQEADAKYLLHNYTQLDYIAGNRIVYGGPYNQIILQGHICYGLGGIAPNGITIGVGTYVGENTSEIPDMPLYQKVTFSPAAYIGTIGVTASLEMRLVSMTNSYAVYAMRYTCEDGKIIEDFTFYNYDGYSGVGFGYAWGTIFPPGSVYHGRTYEYGGAICCWGYRCKSSASAYKWYANSTATYDAYIPFASEAEYNAAVGLTYEPVEMTEVQETVTEV